jgi:predicted O-linked N-acetylglucosamine transferase (SPINDLY family)
VADIQALISEGMRLHLAGDFSGAERAYRQALRSDPGRGDGWYLLGRSCQELGKLDEAVEAHQQAVRLRPGLVEAHNNLGIVLRRLGRVEEALRCYREAVRLRPDYVEARNNLGNALAQLGLHEKAVECFRQVIGSRPDYADAHNNLGLALKQQGRWAEAEACLREAIRLQANHAEAHANLGIVLAEQGHDDQAMACYDRALALRPGLEAALCGRGCVVGRRGELEEAETIFREALRLIPHSSEAWGNLGYFLGEQGKLSEALDAYRQAIRLQPHSATARSNYLYFLNYDSDIDPATLLAEHRRATAAMVAGQSTPSFDGHDRTEGRPLRVGYVSPDFRQHAVASFLEPILANHDRRRVEVIGYADVGSPDAVTARLRSLAHQWREIRNLSDDQVEELIRRDRVDILVDLAGHTARNRLGVFARKPAPVQVTYLGYPGTTGLDTFDAILTDAVVDPPGEPVQSSEEPLRLPGGFCCFAPPLDAPEVSPAPILQNGYPTFGSIHKLPKLNRGVFELWSAVLQAIPSSRILIVRDTLKGRIRAEILAFFEAKGIAPERVEVRHDWKPETHWSIVSSFDIQLDVFPWCGHTTACESLWMGVPIVTLAGRRRASRMTASVLMMTGLTELIAERPEQYVEIASQLVADPQRLAHTRGELRDRVRASRLCDGPAFTRDLETAYEMLWRRWS